MRHQVVVLGRPEFLVLSHPIIGDLVNLLSARPCIGNLTLVGVGEEQLACPDSYAHGADVQDVVKEFGRRMPGMAEAQSHGGWSGLFMVTPDWHPILDGIDHVEGPFAAVGFSGHGFKLAPMVDVVMAGLITYGHVMSLDIEEFGLIRFSGGRLLESRYEMNVLA